MVLGYDFEYVRDKWPMFAAVTATTLVSVYFLKRYFNGGWCHSKARLHGKTVIITGANTGIGFETAKDLAQRGARVILACRDTSKAQEAASLIDTITGSPTLTVVKTLDLGSLASVRQFAQDIIKDEPKIDILINNAGVMWSPYSKTVDGFETQFGINHLGHFLLTNLLLNSLKSASPSRVISISSLAHTRGRIDWEDLMGDNSYGRVKAYSQSKLANVLFTRELSKRLKGTGVTANSVHPGAVRTNLARHIKIIERLLAMMFYPIFWLITKSPHQGAQTTIYCAVAEELKTVSGKYFSDCAVKQEAPLARSDDDARRLWDVSDVLVGLTQRNGT